MPPARHPPPDAELRRGLELRQDALVSGMLAGAPLPTGFDAGRVRVAATSLLRKRARAAARAWPGLAASLGPRFAAEFDCYSSSTPLPERGGPLADGYLFAEWLDERGLLGEAGRVERLAVDLRHARTRFGLVPRRGFVLRMTWLPDAMRLIMAVRLPWLGVRALRLGVPTKRDEAFFDCLVHWWGRTG